MPCLHGFCFYTYNGIFSLKISLVKILSQMFCVRSRKVFFSCIYVGTTKFVILKIQTERIATFNMLFAAHAEINCACKVYMLTLWYHNPLFYAATNISTLLCQRTQLLKTASILCVYISCIYKCRETMAYKRKEIRTCVCLHSS